MSTPGGAKKTRQGRPNPKYSPQDVDMEEDDDGVQVDDPDEAGPSNRPPRPPKNARKERPQAVNTAPSESCVPAALSTLTHARSTLSSLSSCPQGGQGGTPQAAQQRQVPSSSGTSLSLTSEKAIATS